jgi:hypothetical protein
VAQRGARKQTPAPVAYLDQWADTPDTEELTLPSGKRVVAQQPDLPALAKRGLIPNHLLPIVERFVLQGVMPTLRVVNATEEQAAAPGERLTALADFHAYVDAFCVAAVADPPLSFDGKPGTVRVGKLSELDRMHIWQWGAGLVRPLAAFPGDGDGTLATVAAAPDGGEVRDAAEPEPGADAAD